MLILWYNNQLLGVSSNGKTLVSKTSYQGSNPCAPALDFSQERGDWLKNQCPANPRPRFSEASPVAGRGGGGHQHFLFILSFIEGLVVSSSALLTVNLSNYLW